MPPPRQKKRKTIPWSAIAASERQDGNGGKVERYIPPPGVVPASAMDSAMAMDDTPYQYINQIDGFVQNHFKGYQYLALLSQQPEYRKISEDIAQHMVRKWIKIVSCSEEDKTEEVKILENALDRLGVKEAFRRAAEMDGFFGRGQIYLDVKKPDGELAQDDSMELETPLIRVPAKIKKGSFVGIKVVEPVWTYPAAYNSNQPLKKDYYKPSKWFVMGKIIHHSRLLMFVSREVSDLLKASYNFGGLSLTQLAEPYVENFKRTRDSVGDIVHSFSVSGLKVDMEPLLQPGMQEEMDKRIRLFNGLRDNKGLFLLDMQGEEFFQFNTPLSGLDSLQAQAQEQMATVAKEPLIYMFGTTPSGLNATGEGEIKVWHEYVRSMQEALFRNNLNILLEIIQLSELGYIDQDITFEFNPLDEPDPSSLANIEKTKADTDAVLITNGVLMPDEARARLAADPASGYNGIDVAREIETEYEEETDGAESNGE